MLAKKYRLKSNSDISKVFRNGKTVKNSFLFLKYCENQESNFRIAISVGLNHSKKAPKRNRAKRILRASIHPLLEDIKPGYDLVFFFSKDFKDEIKLKETLILVKECLSRANLLK